MRRARLHLSIAAISIAALAATAHAQSAEAEALFNEGDALMKQGKVPQACDSFEASNRVEPRAGTLIRLGECREQNQELAAAWSAYKDALARVKDPKKRDIASARVKQLEPRLSYVTVTVSDANRVDGLTITRNAQPLDSVLWNHTLPLNGGDYTIVAKAPGKKDWSTTITVPIEKGKLEVTVPKLVDASTAEPPKPTKPVVDTPAKKPAEPDEQQPETPPGPSLFTTKRKVAVAAGGVAVVGLAVGIVFGRQAKAKETDAFALCPDVTVSCDRAVEANNLIDEGHTKALVANVMFGVAGAAAIGAVVLWLTGAPPAAETSVAVVPGPGSLTVLGHF